jgi:hypothetical protein
VKTAVGVDQKAPASLRHQRTFRELLEARIGAVATYRLLDADRKSVDKAA